MSASPPTHSAKRPLEEASSPSRPGDQPDAKRPALDKSKDDEDIEVLEAPAEPTLDPQDLNGDEKTNGAKSEQGDVSAADEGPDTPSGLAAAVASSSNAANSAAAHDETSWIHIRAVISSPEAATVIGKGGENVSNIRKLSNAKCTVSDYQKGAVERILTVSGIVDAVAKVRQTV